jgi:hypothetical protein
LDEASNTRRRAPRARGREAWHFPSPEEDPIEAWEGDGHEAPTPSAPPQPPVQQQQPANQPTKRAPKSPNPDQHTHGRIGTRRLTSTPAPRRGGPPEAPDAMAREARSLPAPLRSNRRRPDDGPRRLRKTPTGPRFRLSPPNPAATQFEFQLRRTNPAAASQPAEARSLAPAAAADQPTEQESLFPAPTHARTDERIAGVVLLSVFGCESSFFLKTELG